MPEAGPVASADGRSRSLWWWYLGGLAASALVLLATLGYLSEPNRSLAPELRFLLLSYPAALWASYRTLRRHAPDCLRVGMRVFVVAMVLRMVFTCWAINYSATRFGLLGPLLSQRELPATYALLEDCGYITSDSLPMSIFARFVAATLSKERCGDDVLDTTSFRIGFFGARELRNGGTTEGGTGLTRLRMWDAMGLAVWLCGFSVVATLVPFAALGAYWCVQMYVYLRHHVGAVVAGLVLVYMTVAPEFLCMAAQWQKDLPCAVILTSLLLLLEAPLGSRRWRWACELVWLLAVVDLFRPEWRMVLIVVLAHDLAYRLAGPRPRLKRAISLAAIVGIVVLASVVNVAQLGRSSVPVGLLVNLLVIPGPSFFFGPGVWQKVYAATTLGQSLYWPFVGAWLAVALFLWLRKRLVVSDTLVVAALVAMASLSGRYAAAFGALRFRMMVEPLLWALAIGGFLAARQLPRRGRILTGAWVAGQTMLVFLAHAVVAVRLGD